MTFLFLNFTVYISEDEFDVDFNDVKSLIWYQEALIYGDWYGGRNGDGTVTHTTNIQTTPSLQVSIQEKKILNVVKNAQWSTNFLHPNTAFRTMDLFTCMFMSRSLE